MISGLLFTALRGLVNDRCYPSAFPSEDIAAPGTTVAAKVTPTWPAIRYTIVSAVDEETICDSGGMDTANTTVQIDVVAQTYGAMTTLKDEVINALLATDPPCRWTNYFETKDVETRTHRGVLTYEFHASTGDGSPYP